MLKLTGIEIDLVYIKKQIINIWERIVIQVKKVVI